MATKRKPRPLISAKYLTPEARKEKAEEVAQRLRDIGLSADPMPRDEKRTDIVLEPLTLDDAETVVNALETMGVIL